MKTFIGVILTLFSLFCCLAGVAVAFGVFGEAEPLTGIAMMVGGCVLLALVMFVAGRTVRALKRRFREHASYQREAYLNYGSEIQAVRKKYEEDRSSTKNKELKSYYRWDKRARFKVLKTGKIVYAALIQANEDAFKDVCKDSFKYWAFPGAVVYSPDRYFDACPQELNRIANRLYMNKENSILSRETERFSHLPVDRSITGGREVYMTWVDFHRAFLPVGYMAGRLLPIIVDKEHDERVYVLETKYWTKNLIADFIDGN